VDPMDAGKGEWARVEGRRGAFVNNSSLILPPLLFSRLSFFFFVFFFCSFFPSLFFSLLSFLPLFQTIGNFG